MLIVLLSDAASRTRTAIPRRGIARGQDAAIPGKVPDAIRVSKGLRTRFCATYLWS